MSSTIELREVVNEFYRLVNTQDIETLLELMAENVIWTIPGPSVIPYSGVFRGKDGVRRFFKILDEHEDLESFVADRVIVDETYGAVCVLGHETAVAKPTGRRFKASWAEVFTIVDGKIVAFEEHIDTHALANAYRA